MPISAMSEKKRLKNFVVGVVQHSANRLQDGFVGQDYVALQFKDAADASTVIVAMEQGAVKTAYEIRVTEPNLKNRIGNVLSLGHSVTIARAEITQRDPTGELIGDKSQNFNFGFVRSRGMSVYNRAVDKAVNWMLERHRQHNQPA